MARPSQPASRTQWRRLAERVKARAAELDLTLEQLAAGDGPSRSSWSKLMNATQTSNKMDPAVLRAASIALGWSPASLRLLLLEGTEPQEMESAEEITVEMRLASLEDRVGRLEVAEREQLQALRREALRSPSRRR